MNETPSRNAHAAGASLSQWWSEQVVQGIDRPAVVERVHVDSGWSAHFAFMTLMSAAIAILGLLLSSPAVVIGAMLISPLMGPIIGLGFALATFDALEMRRTLRALCLGIVIAVAFCALLVSLSPLQTVTSEIASRTKPNLFDLLVALFSGLAGTYATIRGRHGTIVGVAIATALMPPLAVMGFGLATGNWPVLAGSSLLFFTNLMTIAAATAVLARIYGFAHHLSPRQTGLQGALIVAALLALAVPLALSLKEIAWETLASRQVRDLLSGHFGSEARIDSIEVDHTSEPIEVSATVLTPRYRPEAERALAGKMAETLGQPVRLALDQVRTAEGDGAALQLAAARGSGVDRRASQVADRLALVAGVPRSQVIVDRSGKRALVRAAPLPGADLASYRALEARVAESESGWTVTLAPPPMALPAVEFERDQPSPAGAAAIETAAWAAKRRGLAITVNGSAARAETVAAALARAGAEARIGEGGGAGPVQLDWVAPGK